MSTMNDPGTITRPRGRPCTICNHPDLAVIDDELTMGVRFRSIAERHGLPATNVHHHAHNHYRAPLRPEEDIFQPEGFRRALAALVARMTRLTDTLETIAPTKAAPAARELRECLRMAAQVTGQIETVEIHVADTTSQRLADVFNLALEAVMARLGEGSVPAELVAQIRGELPAEVRQIVESTATEVP